MASAGAPQQRQKIVAAIGAELDRQGISGVDIAALATAVETAMTSQAPISEGQHPNELKCDQR